jgi:hypothetical protein
MIAPTSNALYEVRGNRISKRLFMRSRPEPLLASGLMKDVKIIFLESSDRVPINFERLLSTRR